MMPGMLLVADLVELLEELDRLEVLVAAEDVGDPLAGLPRIVEVEHRGDGVDPEAVDVVALEPEQGVAEEEVLHLGPAVVEDLRAPVLVLAEPGVLVLVEVGAVEEAEAVEVLGEVAGDPVDQDAEAVAGAACRRSRRSRPACRAATSARSSRPAGSPSCRRRGAR